MKISNAYVCSSCHEISEGASRGRCQVCDSSAVFPVGWLTRTPEERARWFDRIWKRTPAEDWNSKSFKKAA